MPKKNAIPFRPDPDTDAIVEALARATGMPKSEILRRACRFALPKFASGEVDISRIIAPVPAPVP